MIEAANKNAAQIGFFYLCNPNNPTGVVVTAKEVKQVIEGIPKDMPILIDEAYHHFVDDPAYGTAVPYILEGRPVIVARTFSKIAALAAMRIGYALAPAEIIRKMRPYSMGSVNALAKWGAVASLKDTAGQADVRKKVIDLRNKTTRELEAHGYPTIPSQTNFFMVSLEGRTVQPVIEEFREKGILVGRPFPPMINHLRVSIGTAEDMDKFLKALQGNLPEEDRDDDGARIAPENGARIDCRAVAPQERGRIARCSNRRGDESVTSLFLAIVSSRGNLFPTYHGVSGSPASIAGRREIQILHETRIDETGRRHAAADGGDSADAVIAA